MISLPDFQPLFKAKINTFHPNLGFYRQIINAKVKVPILTNLCDDASFHRSKIFAFVLNIFVNCKSIFLQTLDR